MTNPISSISERIIGSVESVSPVEIKILLDIESPRNIALNTGYPTSFPKINSFLLLPNENGFLVGSITWLGVEKSAYPKRDGLKDFGLIDLPYPLRKLTITPLGTLVSTTNDSFELQVGIKSFPSVGDSVILPTQEQISIIVQGKEDDQIVKIGTCPTAHDAEIKIHPNKLFGRHLAVLGNTGGGKSCSVASLIRSMIERGRNNDDKINARFIVLDPNGEYSNCFKDLGVNVLKIGEIKESEKKFKLPAWFWNGEEWSAILKAAPGIQQPALKDVIRNLKSGISHNSLSNDECCFVCIKSFYEAVVSPLLARGAMSFPTNKNFGMSLKAFTESLDFYKGKGVSVDENELSKINEILTSKSWSNTTCSGYNDFSVKDLDKIKSNIRDILAAFSSRSIDLFNISEDAPIEFNINLLEQSLQDYAAISNINNVGQNIAPLISRIRTLLSDSRISEIISTSDISFKGWLEDVISIDSSKPITVIDLSLAPYEIIHLIIAVTSRLILEAHQRYKKAEDKNLPTVLILEEAHTFVSKGSSISEEITTRDMCRKSFEKIAREGRKFGLGLVLSSQRPSELSETVLSQCNSFMLHRITNDRDQELIARLVPDTSRGILKELPTLPQGCAIVLGAVTTVPVVVEMNILNKENRPKSDDPKYWEEWNNSEKITWDTATKDWIKDSKMEEVPLQEDAELMGGT